MRKKRMSRSNQALNLAISTINLQKGRTTHSIIQHILNNQFKDRQLFKQSYNKIQSLKAILTRKSSKQLMQQLNDVIDLIRGQRAKAKITIDQLHNLVNNESVPLRNQRIMDTSMNTQDLLPESFQEETVDQSIQTQTPQNQQQLTNQQKQLKNKEKKYQCYYKLVCMVNNLKVDYREILPIIPNLPSKYVLPNVDAKINIYKVLKPQEKIKLQKVFINKLNCMTNNQYYRAKQLKQQMINTQIAAQKTPQKNTNKQTQPNTEGSVTSQVTKSAQSITQQIHLPQKAQKQHYRQGEYTFRQKVTPFEQKITLNNKPRQRQNSHKKLKSKQKSLSKSKQKQQLQYRIRDKKPTFYQLNRKRVM